MLICGDSAWIRDTERKGKDGTLSVRNFPPDSNDSYDAGADPVGHRLKYEKIIQRRQNNQY